MELSFQPPLKWGELRKVAQISNNTVLKKKYSLKITNKFNILTNEKHNLMLLIVIWEGQAPFTRFNKSFERPLNSV